LFKLYREHVGQAYNQLVLKRKSIAFNRVAKTINEAMRSRKMNEKAIEFREKSLKNKAITGLYKRRKQAR
jgi:hypothetical protein